MREQAVAGCGEQRDSGQNNVLAKVHLELRL
jgi:hypothetical protein